MATKLEFEQDAFRIRPDTKIVLASQAIFLVSSVPFDDVTDPI